MRPGAMRLRALRCIDDGEELLADLEMRPNQFGVRHLEQNPKGNLVQKMDLGEFCPSITRQGI